MGKEIVVDDKIRSISEEIKNTYADFYKNYIDNKKDSDEKKLFCESLNNVQKILILMMSKISKTDRVKKGFLGSVVKDYSDLITEINTLKEIMVSILSKESKE